MSSNLLLGSIPASLSGFSRDSFDTNGFPTSVTPHHNELLDLSNEERKALQDLYDSTNGANWAPYQWPADSNGQLIGDPCFDDWPGVACDVSSPSHVTYVRSGCSPPPPPPRECWI